MMLTVTFCISQSGYPQKVIINKDTVVAITGGQLKQVNLALEAGEGYKEQLDTTLVRLNQMNAKISENRQFVNSNLQLIVLLNEQLKTTDKKVGNAEENIKQLKEELSYQKKKTVRLVIVSSAVTLSAASIFYFITK